METQDNVTLSMLTGSERLQRNTSKFINNLERISQENKVEAKVQWLKSNGGKSKDNV